MYVEVRPKHNSTMVSDASPCTADPKMSKSFVHTAQMSSDRACAQDGYFKRPHPTIIDDDKRSDSCCPGKKIRPGRVFGNDPLGAVRIGYWSGFIIFFHHGGTMAWRGWSSVFQDSVKSMVPHSWVKSPNGFCDFLATTI
jgi:hypothetical protein